MKIALASVISASAPAAPEWNRIRNTSAVFRKLSLNAAKNWHQNSGAKRLDSIRGGGMPLIIAKFPLAGRAPPIGKKKSGGLLAACRLATDNADYGRALTRR